MQFRLRACLLMGFLSFYSFSSAQDQTLSDSLTSLYNSGAFNLDDELVVLKGMAANETNPDEALVLSLVLIAVSLGVLVALRDRYLGGSSTPPA